MFKKILQFPLVKDFIIAVVIILAIIFSLSYILESVTRHNESVLVPDLGEMTLEEACSTLKAQGFKYTVLDSSKFFKDKAPRQVIEQDPSSDTPVKKGRMIYLKINRSKFELVAIPFVDFEDDKRSDVERRLRTSGFTVGRTIHIPHLGTDVVLGLQSRGRAVSPGDKLAKSSVIDLLVGNGFSQNQVDSLESDGDSVARGTSDTSSPAPDPTTEDF